MLDERIGLSFTNLQKTKIVEQLQNDVLQCKIANMTYLRYVISKDSKYLEKSLCARLKINIGCLRSSDPQAALQYKQT